MKSKNIWRRLTQVVCAMLYNFNITGFFKGSIYQGDLKGLCVPGLNCYSCPGATFACPLGSLQSALVSAKYKIPYYVMGLLLLFGVLLGRIVCGFLCPFGFLQELLYKIPTPKLKKSKVTYILSYLKYVVLVVFAIAIPLTFHVPGFCKYICPAGTLEGGIILTAMNPQLKELAGLLFIWKVVLLVGFLISFIFVFRSFCRFICPLGAFYSLFHKLAIVKITVDESKCNHCDVCVKQCKMDVKKVGDHECIQCGECRGNCHACAIHYGGK